MARFRREAVLEWIGDVPRGSGRITAGSGAFEAAATFPRLAGEPAGATTPEELLAASHATCFGIGVRSLLAHAGGAAGRIRVIARITADKDAGRIRVMAADLEADVEGLTGIDHAALEELARRAEEACTISALLRPSVPISITVRIDAAEVHRGTNAT